MAATEIIKVQTGELVVPTPRNEGAAIALRRMSAVLAQLPAGIDSASWASAVIAEANGVKASPNSIAMCVYNLAFIGLMPGKILGHAHFVPFGGEAQLIIGYRGWIHLGYSTGFLRDIHTDVICDGEPIEIWTDEHGQHMRHVPNFNRAPDRKSIIGAYCIYHTKDGGNGLRIINKADIGRSDKNRDVWQSNYEMMVRKTAVLRCAKMWQTTGRLAQAIAIDEQAERDEVQSLPPGLELDVEPVAAESYRLPVE